MMLKTVCFVCFCRLFKDETWFFFFNLYQDSRAAFTSMSFIWNRKKILWPEDKCSSLLRHLSWWRWNPSWRKRVIVFSVVEDGPSNETRVHESELQKAAGSLTGKMNPRVPVAALGHSIGQAFNERPYFEMLRLNYCSRPCVRNTLDFW